MPKPSLRCPICKQGSVKALDTELANVVRLVCGADADHLDIRVEPPRSHLSVGSCGRLLAWLQNAIYESAMDHQDAVTVLGKLQLKNERIEQLEKRLKLLSGPVIEVLKGQAARWHQNHCKLNDVDEWWLCWHGPCAQARTAIQELRYEIEVAEIDDIRPSRSG